MTLVSFPSIGQSLSLSAIKFQKKDPLALADLPSVGHQAQPQGCTPQGQAPPWPEDPACQAQ